MRKVFKLLIILFLMIIVINILIPLKSLAMDSEYYKPEQFDDYTNFAKTKIPNANVTGENLMYDLMGRVLNLLRLLALGWAIIMGISIATKYMGTSPQVKAQLKTDIPTYLIGSAILFGATGILTLIQYFVKDTTG